MTIEMDEAFVVATEILVRNVGTPQEKVVGNLQLVTAGTLFTKAKELVEACKNSELDELVEVYQKGMDQILKMNDKQFSEFMNEFLEIYSQNDSIKKEATPSFSKPKN